MKKFSTLLMAIFCFAINLTLKAQISGTVFRDFNANGTKDNSASFNEPFESGITVNVYNTANALVATAITAGITAPNYSFTSLQIPFPGNYRVEFSGLSAGDYPGFSGTTNKTNVQFVSAASAITDFAISYPDWYSNTTNPYLVTNTYRNGNAAINTGANNPGTQNNMLIYPYNLSVASTAAVQNQYLGSVFGLAYQKETKKIFNSAYLRRHSSFLANRIGGIYTSDLTTPASPVNATLLFSSPGHPNLQVK